MTTLFDIRFLTTDFRAIAKVHGLVDHQKEVRSRAAKQGNQTKKLKSKNK